MSGPDEPLKISSPCISKLMRSPSARSPMIRRKYVYISVIASGWTASAFTDVKRARSPSIGASLRISASIRVVSSRVIRGDVGCEALGEGSKEMPNTSASVAGVAEGGEENFEQGGERQTASAGTAKRPATVQAQVAAAARARVFGVPLVVAGRTTVFGAHRSMAKGVVVGGLGPSRRCRAGGLAWPGRRRSVGDDARPSLMVMIRCARATTRGSCGSEKRNVALVAVELLHLSRSLSRSRRRWRWVSSGESTIMNPWYDRARDRNALLLSA